MLNSIEFCASLVADFGPEEVAERRRLGRDSGRGVRFSTPHRPCLKAVAVWRAAGGGVASRRIYESPSAALSRKVALGRTVARSGCTMDEDSSSSSADLR